MSERYFGFRVISARSHRDLDTLRIIVENMGEIWPGAKIKVRYLVDLPRSPKFRITFQEQITTKSKLETTSN